MATYLVTYDLKREVVRPKIVDAIKRWGAWAKLSESSYAIATQQTPQAVYQALSHLLDDNDQLYVITLTKPYSGQGPVQVNDWLENKLA
ncbi:hypothetical protein [Roseicella aerolata]|uniref:Uncharacterized protein n=1 Tax=Roseicella aerolata TaxID=2883479 RepID=A0A9X1IJ14_9PROT|nr:hypothetical protein [Roseicella aerolata]MCB4825522.1 hypothetical protein [Roseicella aerolata]